MKMLLFCICYLFPTVYGGQITSTEGVIVSPLYPAMYHAQGEYTWRVDADIYPSYYAVEVEELSIEMNPGEDTCLSSLEVSMYDLILLLYSIQPVSLLACIYSSHYGC